MNRNNAVIVAGLVLTVSIAAILILAIAARQTAIVVLGSAAMLANVVLAWS